MGRGEERTRGRREKGEEIGGCSGEERRERIEEEVENRGGGRGEGI